VAHQRHHQNELFTLLAVDKTYNQVLDKVVGELDSILKNPKEDANEPVEHLCANIHNSLSL
jgi:hypothetical protein